VLQAPATWRAGSPLPVSPHQIRPLIGQLDTLPEEALAPTAQSRSGPNLALPTAAYLRGLYYFREEVLAGAGRGRETPNLPLPIPTRLAARSRAWPFFPSRCFSPP
jgi:hypothetical protein